MSRSHPAVLPLLWAMVRLWIAAVLLAGLAACGGGGGGTGAVPLAPAGALAGQVAKGLTQGATVRLYSVDVSGQRALLASALSDASGEFQFAHVLQIGQVYLLEALGGQYVHEITGATEPLSAPLRGVFVASGNESRLALSALSEVAVIELEQSGAPANWGAAAVAQADARAASKFGLPSTMGHRFLDMTTASPGSMPTLADTDAVLSFQVGVFAGFWQELRLRTPGLTLAQALQAFHAVSMQSDPDRQWSSALIAGMVRFVERVPAFDASRGAIFAAAGLPPNASSAAFDGAKTSGQALAAVPNRTLRLLDIPSFGNVPAPDTETYFDARGALVASKASTTGLRHVGTSSVADVYGDADLAIGRWNKGFEHPGGVTYDAATNRFQTDDVPMQPLGSDYIYAAGRTASNLPSCGTVYMSPRANTAAFRSHDGARSYTLDAASRIGFHHANGQTLIGYDIILRDDLGVPFTFTTPYSADEAPWRGRAMINHQEFAPSGLTWLPTGELVRLHGLLVGDGGTKAVLRITTSHGSGATSGLAAAFAQDGITRPCGLPGFSPGSVDPAPSTGDYYVSTSRSHFLVFHPALQFLPGGAPLLPVYSGITASTAVEKAGNDVAGIGVLVPPYGSANGNIPQTSTQAYAYLKFQPLPVVTPAQTGVLTYRLVASTSQIVYDDFGLITVAPAFTSATLTIDLDNYQGAPNAYFGTCQLAVNGQKYAPGAGTFVKSDGICMAATGVSFFTGGITGADHRQAVLRYEYTAFGSGGAGLLFERVP